MYPEVLGYGDFEVEPFDKYYEKWPEELKSIPKEIVEHWVYRHWQQFQSWIHLNPHKWEYNLIQFNNEEIMKIDHFGNEIEGMDARAREIMEGKPRSEAWLPKNMLETGTVPTPIMVAHNGGNIIHPYGWDTDFMKEPYQIIEGHERLTILRGMINFSHSSLKKKHSVWLIKVGNTHEKKK